MTIKHLSIFCAVCRERSMTAAAEHLHMTQPAVSRAVAELEGYYKKKFFDRIGRRLLLTSDGLQMLNDAERVLTAFETLESHNGLQRAASALNIGCSLGIGFAYMEHWLEAFKSACPDTRVYITENPTDILQQGLLTGELDLAVTEGFITNSSLLSMPFRRDELLVLAAPGHPLAEQQTVSAEELSGYDFVLPDRITGTRALFDNIMASRGITIRPIWSCTDFNALLRMARQGRGLTVLSRTWADESLKSGTLVPLPVDFTMFRQYSVVYHRNKNLPAEALKFMDICRNEPD